jgi:S1-C subfamily serine protease
LDTGLVGGIHSLLPASARGPVRFVTAHWVRSAAGAGHCLGRGPAMSVQGDSGHRLPQGSDEPRREEADPWTSTLWSRPDTVGGYARQPDAATPELPWSPAQPQPTRRREVAVLAAVLALVLLVGGAALASTLFSTGTTTAAPPTPSVTAPSTPARPTPSSPTPSSPTAPPTTAPPTTAPSAPPGVVPGTPPSTAPQQDDLTPEQSATAAAVSQGLVDVNTTIGYDGAQGAGTGIVLSADGLVLTNHHVVAGSTAIRATSVGNGRTYDATVLGYDSTHDVAVLRLEDASGLTVAPLGSSSTVQVGDAVLAIGNAGGDGGAPSVVAGTVRALDQDISVRDDSDGSVKRLAGLIQLDAAIAPGDSGGAVVDDAGKVVGVVTAGSAGATPGDSTTMVDGFAVPIDEARSIAQQIIDGRASDTVHIGSTGFLGVQVAPGTPPGSAGAGAQVAGVVPGSAAERAGIEEGDVITAVDGTSVTSAAALHSTLAAQGAGDTVKVAWTDTAGEKHTERVRLGSGPVG